MDNATAGLLKENAGEAAAPVDDAAGLLANENAGDDDTAAADAAAGLLANENAGDDDTAAANAAGDVLAN